MILPIGLALALSACSGKDDSPFGSGGSNDNPPITDGGSSDGGSSDGGADGGSDGGTDGGADGGSGDGGADGGDTGIVIEGTGYRSGDVAYDLAGTASSGTFSLHALYGSPVLLVVGNMDNSGFAGMMAWMDQIDSVVTVALIGRDETGVAADAADASRLASKHGVDHVVIDPTGELLNTWAERNPPKSYLIQPDMTIFWTYFGTVGQVQVEDKIDDMGF